MNRTILFMLLILSVHLQAHAEEKTSWKDLLQIPVLDEWQPIFVESPAGRPAETWAQKFTELQSIIRKSTGGRDIPLYLSPELAATTLPHIRKREEEDRTKIPLRHVSALELLKYISSLNGLRLQVTEDAVLLDKQPPASAAS